MIDIANAARSWAVFDARSAEKRLATRPFELEPDFAMVADRVGALEGEVTLEKVLADLPGIWVTPPALDAEGTVEGRTYSDFYEARQPDAGGSRALRVGCNYYREAMELQDESQRRDRVECFQAAEMFYLHAARRGNAQAFANLGYVYSYDRCENSYWERTVRWMSSWDIDESIAASNAFPREVRAYECFLRAHEGGVAEATYKLGDLVSRGCGCAQDDARAFALFEEAFERGRSEDPIVWGSAALRLGGCCEEGRGCERDVARALEWYELAGAGLSAGVNAGDWYYVKQRDRARKAVKRMRQELALR